MKRTSARFPEILLANGALAYSRISWKVDNLTRYSQILEFFISGISVRFDFPQEFGSFAILKFRPRLYCAGEISTRRFHCDSRIKCFPSTLRRRNLKTAFSLWLMHQMFSVHTTPEKFPNATIIGYFRFVFKKMDREYDHMIIVMSSFVKLRFDFFTVHSKMESQRSQIPPVWRAFS